MVSFTPTTDAGRLMVRTYATEVEAYCNFNCFHASIRWGEHIGTQIAEVFSFWWIQQRMWGSLLPKDFRIAPQRTCRGMNHWIVSIHVGGVCFACRGARCVCGHGYRSHGLSGSSRGCRELLRLHPRRVLWDLVVAEVPMVCWRVTHGDAWLYFLPLTSLPLLKARHDVLEWILWECWKVGSHGCGILLLFAPCAVDVGVGSIRVGLEPQTVG